MSELAARQILAPRFGGPEVLEVVDIEVPPAGPGEVTIEVRAVGLNPADYKGFSGKTNPDPAQLPIRPGFEVAGVVSAIGADTELASGGGAVGDAVLAFRISGGYASFVTVPAKNVFAMPRALTFPAAANLLLAATTAADMLDAVQAAEGDTLLVHGASGAVGVSLLQQARLLGAHVIGTAAERRFEVVRDFGAQPVEYGPGLADRVRALAPGGVAAALDTVGTDEAVDVSLELVADHDRIVTIAAFQRAQRDGILFRGGGNPDSVRFRNAVRQRLVDLAASGDLVVPVAQTFPLAKAGEALTLLAQGHAGGKLALIP